MTYNYPRDHCGRFEPVKCDYCGDVMTYSENADALLCGPSGSGCEGTKPVPEKT